MSESANFLFIKKNNFISQLWEQIYLSLSFSLWIGQYIRASSAFLELKWCELSWNVFDFHEEGIFKKVIFDVFDLFMNISWVYEIF